VRLAGIGASTRSSSVLRRRPAAAGWFAAERKRQLPAFPRRIGIVTSPRAAALSDILTTLKRRWSSVAVILYPAMVQGEGAAADIARAIATASARGEVDVLIVARGGGSIEDLWAFNEEVVARAIIESSLPIVSGVGHETDFTICDFTADARAPTPTAAAMLVVPTGPRSARTSEESHGAGGARACTRCRRGSSGSTASRVASSIRRPISRDSARRPQRLLRGSIVRIEPSSRPQRARCVSIAAAWRGS
jgi:exodeoxyribonuclease VII large subunit